MGKIVKSLLVAAVFIGLSFAFPALAPMFITMAVSTVLAGVSQQFLAPKVPRSQLSRLNVSLDPTTPRKAVFGTTAMNLDLRYHETSGSNQEYIDYIIAVAAHKVTSIDEIWLEEKQAWTASGGVTGTYSGYLTVQTRTEGTAGNTIAINGGSKWGSSRRLTGCAYVHLRIKRTGNSKKAESPLVNGLPSRVTIIGNGALLYDPRKDSTVTGGSGSHRANDQSTWGVYTDADDCDNPALQLLWWLLGWKINGKLSIGCGVPYTRIDMESFITAANICDESVILATGGTQKRYRTSGTASDADDRMDVISTFLTSMNGTLRDNSGKLSVTIMKNDLADYVLDLDESDMLGEFEWQQTRGLADSHNVARGRYIDPSTSSLYQPVDYPEVGFTSSDGIERVLTVDLMYVEDGRRAQRIAKQVLQRNQYRGMFSATFSAKALGCQVGDVVRLSIEALGWSNKPFRVVSQEIRFDGQVPLALVEENAAIYAWDREDSAPVTPTAPTVYDPLNSPFILGIDEALESAATAQATADGKIESFYQATMPAGGSEGDLWIDTDDGNKLYRHNGITFIEVQDDAISTAIVAASTAQATADGKVTTFYSNGSPTAEAVGDLWFDTDDGNKLYRWSGSAWLAVQDTAITTAINAASDAQATADGKVTTFTSETSPTADAVGDLWFKVSTGELRRWNGSAWGDPLVDLTSNAVPSLDQVAPVSFAADYLGVLSAGQLPKNINVVRRRGGTDVSDSTTWSILSQTGITGGTVTVSSTGVVTIPTGVTVAKTGAIEVRSVRNGTTLDATIGVTRVDAAPPVTGGGGGGTTVSDSTFNSFNSTSFVAVSDLLTVKTGSSGQIQFSANLAVYTDAEAPGVTGTEGDMELKWQYRTVGGSFADVATAVASDPDVTTYYDSDLEAYVMVEGYVNSSPTKTSLSTSTDYEVQLFARRTSSTPTKTLYLVGTASAVGS